MAANRILTRAEIAELCGCKPAEIPHAPRYSLVNYHPPGPVGAAYIRALGPIDAITGPAGSGKTVASIFKLIRFAVAVMPVCRDGVVRVRGTVLRDNYRAMYRTTVRSWFHFFPPDWEGSVFTGGADRPAQHLLKLSTVRLVDGVQREVNVELTMDFFAVGDVAIEELLKGYETSFVWCNEADLLAERVIPFSYSRTGRYPAREDLPEAAKRPRLVAVDFNPPSPKHPLWLACKAGTFNAAEHEDGDGDKKPAASINFFQQPSGLSAEAENRMGKTYEEYLEDARTLTEEDVRRFVHGLPGYSSDGKPVYGREFRGNVHVAAGPVPVIPGLPLHVGFDQGLTPAAVLFQRDTFGQLRFVREVFLGHGVGIARFVEAMRVELLGRFRDLPPGIWSADPAGFYGKDRVAGELAWAESVAQGLGHAIMPAPSNEPAIRMEAIRLPLRLMLDQSKPALIIDPAGCPMLIEAFEAEYKFPKKTDGSFQELPVKNLHANVMEAAQYGVLGEAGRYGVIAEAGRAGRPGNVASLQARRGPATDFDVFAC